MKLTTDLGGAPIVIDGTPEEMLVILTYLVPEAKQAAQFRNNSEKVVPPLSRSNTQPKNKKGARMPAKTYIVKSPEGEEYKCTGRLELLKVAPIPAGSVGQLACRSAKEGNGFITHDSTGWSLKVCS